MSLHPGARIGPYEVLSSLGAGGMGEVYRARDTKLGRDVALKILPDVFAADPERLARFEREARTLASLNHPHIAHLHGLQDSESTGSGEARARAIVMELVEGEDLAAKIRRGPIALDEALAIARQVASALEGAHEQGIVHRDLKPANIKVRSDGVVKLLDFGLAKAFEGGSGVMTAGALENSPTITSPLDMTLRGVILGTAAYMAPEQAKGRAVDKRADVWAFGVVLYEMLVGSRPFVGSDTTDLIAQVLERTPDWTALPAHTPSNVRRLLRRCLEKDRRRRLRDCGDALLELSDPAPDQPDSGGATPSHWSRSPVVVGLAGLVIGTLGAGVWNVVRSTEPVSSSATGVTRFGIDGPTDRAGGGRLPVAISADGRRVVYVTSRQLQVRSFDDLTPRPLLGTEPEPTPAGARGNTGVAIQPILSPDGETVAYFQAGQLRRVPIAGGAPTVICACPNAFGATWGRDDTILFGRASSAADTAGVWRVAATGGAPERVMATEPGQTALRPQMLPDGDHVLFTLGTGEHWDDANLVVQSIRTGARRVLVDRGVDGRYLASGYLVFGRDAVLHAVKFNLQRLEISGSPVPVLSGVSQQTSSGAWGGFEYAVSDEGTLVYVPAAVAAIRRVLVWVDRTGRVEELPTEPRAYQYPRFSPDGDRVALDLRDQQNDVWMWDLNRATLTRLTIGRRAGGPAIWSGDGRSVLFGPDVRGGINVHEQGLTGGPPRRLTTSPNIQFVDVITPDGKWLVLADVDPISGFDLLMLRLEGSDPPQELIRTPFNEQNAHISPDGRWIAYQSDESGRFEIYVRPFPRVGDARWPVSASGGTRPLWAKDGRELFFLDQNRRMTVVTVDYAPTLRFGRPQVLFETAQFGLEGQQRNFDLAPDGRRFLMVKNLPPPDNVAPLVVIQNWFAELRAKAP